MKRALFFVLIFVMCFSINSFAYNTSDWALEEIREGENYGLIPQSIKDNDLTQSITREEFAEICITAYEVLSQVEVEDVLDNPFLDTENPEVLKAYGVGIIKGVSDTEFYPDALLVREEAAVMLARIHEKVMTREIKETFDYEYDKNILFDDDDKISSWARSAVYFMRDNGIIKGIGKNCFAPKNSSEDEVLSGYANITREQAIILVKRLVESGLFEGKLGGDIDPYGSAKQDEINADENTYTVAFIGGSLTEGGHSWIMSTVNLLQEHMPDKKVQFLNAGKGGTASNYGAARFMHDVGDFNPDMVIIEFAVNDHLNGLGEAGSRIYMESMVRMCMNLKKTPSIIFLYAPIPVEKTDSAYTSWENVVMSKEKIAKHYGLKSINIYEYMQNDYNATKTDSEYKTFTDYLSTMYNKNAAGFDVHGGYSKYSEAIVKAFTDDYDGCFTKPNKDKSIYCQSNKSLVNARYETIDVNSPRMKYSGIWSTYTKENPFKDSSNVISINPKHYLYPYFTNGIKQSLKEPSAFGFMTSASAFCLNYVSASVGSKVKVYVDMVEKGTLTCYSSIHGMNYTGTWFDLPNDGKEHKVIMVVEDATDSNYVFRFGSVIERYER